MYILSCDGLFLFHAFAVGPHRLIYQQKKGREAADAAENVTDLDAEEVVTEVSSDEADLADEGHEEYLMDSILNWAMKNILMDSSLNWT